MKYFAVALLALLIGVAATRRIWSGSGQAKGSQTGRGQDQGSRTQDQGCRAQAQGKGRVQAQCPLLEQRLVGGDKVSVSDLREMTIPAGGTITVDAGRNGGVGVKGEDRNDVLVRACVQTWGTSEEAAKAVAGSVRIGTSGVIKAEGRAVTSKAGRSRTRSSLPERQT